MSHLVIKRVVKITTLGPYFLNFYTFSNWHPTLWPIQLALKDKSTLGLPAVTTSVQVGVCRCPEPTHKKKIKEVVYTSTTKINTITRRQGNTQLKLMSTIS